MKEARYFHVPDAAVATELPQEEAQHAARVLRLEAGDEVFLMDGAGTFYRAELTLVSQKHCLYNIVEALPKEKAWCGNIRVAIAPTKNIDRMEWMVEKCTEVGFDEVTFLSCKFSERKQIRQDRMEKIVVSAAKQSRKPFFPVVNGMEDFRKFVSECRSDKKYICHCYGEIERKDFFRELSAAEGSSDVTILIGPEGDFSVDEVRYALDQGFESVTLGDFRLRTETAGLVATTVSQMLKRKEQVTR